jgi:hypothetical protein
MSKILKHKKYINNKKIFILLMKIKMKNVLYYKIVFLKKNQLSKIHNNKSVLLNNS